MNASSADPILNHMCRLVGGPESRIPDRDLLERYLQHRDEIAFAEMVRRHGAMVLGVCRSVLRDRQEAEDALQATYLVLARQAKSIRQRDGLASWLHGVAYRVAHKAERAKLRRRQHETRVSVAESAVSMGDLSFSEVTAILHAELAAMPERYREPLVLCYLEGLTQDEAGHRLGWTPNSVKGRLQRGRQMLRHRLARRDLGLPATLGAAALAAACANASMSPALIEMTVGLAHAPTASMALLAKHVAGSTIRFKLKAFAPLLMLGIGLAVGITWAIAKKGQQPPAANAKPQNPPVLDSHGDPLPDGAVARLGTIRFNHGKDLDALLYTSDGKTIISKGGGFIRLWDAETGKELRHIITPKTAQRRCSAVASGRQDLARPQSRIQQYPGSLGLGPRKSDAPD